MTSRTKSGGLLRASMVSYYGGETITDLSFDLSSKHCLDISSSAAVSETNVCKARTFVTGSVYTGEYGTFGMAGAGKYRMPHGVEYEGGFNAGNFEQMGILYYPSGARIEGFWFSGKLIWSKYYFSDDLPYHHRWHYCIMPDRRFFTERQYQLQPYDVCQITNKIPHRAVPSGFYDTGDGFYSPKTKCVTHPITKKILRIPTKTEEEWIIENCRKGNDENVGFRKDLYENWFDVGTSQEDYMSVLKLKMPVFECLEEEPSPPPSRLTLGKLDSSATATHTEYVSVMVSDPSMK